MLNIFIGLACLTGGVWSCAATSGGGVTTAPTGKVLSLFHLFLVCSATTAIDTTVPGGLDPDAEAHAVVFSNQQTLPNGVTTIDMSCTPITNPTTSMTVNGDITLQNPSVMETYTLSCGGAGTNTWTFTPPTGPPPITVTSAYCQG